MPNSTIKPSACKQCGSPYHSAMYHKPRKPIAVNKPLPRPKRRIKQQGARTLAYNQWRDEVARPYLIQKYGAICQYLGCLNTEGLEIDHIKGRGSHPELKMTLTNVQFLCHTHHREKTDHLSPDASTPVITAAYERPDTTLEAVKNANKEGENHDQ